MTVFGNTTRIVRVELEDRETTLFHGAVGKTPQTAHYGVGFTTACGKRRFWGTVVPRSVIQSWRAYQILQDLPWLDSTVLCAAMEVAKRTLDVEGEGAHLQKIACCRGIAVGDLVVLRNRLLGTVPETDELDLILGHLYIAGIEIDAWELEEELRLGLIERTPYVELAMAAYPLERAVA